MPILGKKEVEGEMTEEEKREEKEKLEAVADFMMALEGATSEISRTTGKLGKLAKVLQGGAKQAEKQRCAAAAKRALADLGIELKALRQAIPVV